MTAILKAPNGIRIGKVCHCEFSPAFCGSEPDYKATAEEFYATLKESGAPVVNVTEPALVFRSGSKTVSPQESDSAEKLNQNTRYG